MGTRETVSYFLKHHQKLLLIEKLLLLLHNHLKKNIK